MSKKYKKLVIKPQLIEVVDVDTTPEEVLEAATRAEKAFVQGMQNGQGTPSLKQAVLLFVNLVRSSLIGEVRFDIEEDEVAAILKVLLYEPGYTFTQGFPYTREQIIADLEAEDEAEA